MKPSAVLPVDEIRLGQPLFWKRPLEEREGAFQTLRRIKHMPCRFTPSA